MSPYYEEDGITIYCGDSLDILRTMPSCSINCCVTSPPYFGLRDYGVAGQIGGEQTYPEYLNHLVEVFAEVRRVLLENGTLWLDIGDSYATGAGAVGNCPGGGQQGDRWRGASPKDQDPKRSAPRGPMTQSNRLPQPGLKPKDLMMIPARVALALQQDGWYLRSDIIWHKPNPMPESVMDRPTNAHEHIFLLAKSEKYFYDADAIREPFSTDPAENYPARARITGRGDQAFAEARGNDRGKSGGFPPASHKGSSFNRGKTANHQLGRASDADREDSPLGRNKRNVWTIPTRSYPEAHFATFPPDLVIPCVKAGCPAGAIVLDPFCGSGTTMAVARQLGRRGIGIDLNPDYCTLAADRLRQGMLDLAEPML